MIWISSDIPYGNNYAVVRLRLPSMWCVPDSLMRSLLIEICRIFLDHPRKCLSSWIRMWSMHSRRRLPMNRSQIPFTWGDRYSVISSCMPELNATAKKRVAFFITIAHQIVRSLSPWHRFARPSRRPFIGWIFCHPGMDYPSRFQFHHHKDIPLPKQPVIYYREVACPDATRLILQERCPSLAQWRCLPIFQHVSLDGSFTHFYPQLQQFTPYSLGSP